MKRLALLLLALPAFGAITASPTSLSVSMRAPVVFPWIATMFPKQPAALYDYTFTLSGTGAWTAVLTGNLNTQCMGPCLSISSASGTGAGTITISYFQHGGENLTVGTHTGTLTIGSTAVALSVVVVAANAFMPFTYRAGYPAAGCTNPNSTGYSFLSQCPVSNERPPSTAFAIPTVCGSYTDSAFGATVKRLTPAGPHNTYSSIVSFSANNKYVYTSTVGGSNAIYKLSDCSVAYSAVAGLAGDVTYLDPSDDEKIWYLASGVLKNVELNTNTVTTAGDYTSSSGSRPAMNDINVGNGTTSISDDGLLAGNANTASEIVVINTVGLTTANQESHIWYNTFASGGMSSVNYADITPGVDSVTGKRYVLECGSPKASVYSLGAGTTLTFEFNVPQGTFDYNSCQHGGLGEMPDGQQVLFYQIAGTGNENYVVTELLNTGTCMTVPIEIACGSGMGGLSYLYTGNHIGASEFACNKRHFCVQGTYETPGITPDPSILSVTNGAVCTITTAAAHGLGSIGSTPSVQVGGSISTGINGVWTATITSTTQLTIPTTCPGSYTPNSGTVALNVSSTADYPNRNEIIVTWLGNAVYRIAQTRNKAWADNAGLYFYYSLPFAGISRDGRYVAFNSNMGVPEQTSVYIVETGLGGSTGSLHGNGIRGGNAIH